MVGTATASGVQVVQGENIEQAGIASSVATVKMHATDLSFSQCINGIVQLGNEAVIHATEFTQLRPLWRSLSLLQNAALSDEARDVPSLYQVIKKKSEERADGSTTRSVNAGEGEVPSFTFTDNNGSTLEGIFYPGTDLYIEIVVPISGNLQKGQEPFISKVVISFDTVEKGRQGQQLYIEVRGTETLAKDFIMPLQSAIQRSNPKGSIEIF